MLQRFLCLLIVCGFLAGCSAEGETKSLTVAPDANFNHAIEIDLVTVAPEIVPLFAEMKAKDWFENKQAFLLQYQDSFAKISLQLVPRGIKENIKWGKLDGKKLQYFAFVNWVDEAEKYQFGNKAPERLLIDKTSLKVEMSPEN